MGAVDLIHVGASKFEVVASSYVFSGGVEGPVFTNVRIYTVSIYVHLVGDFNPSEKY